MTDDGGARSLATFTSRVGTNGPTSVAVVPGGEVVVAARSGGCSLWRLTDGGAESVVGTRTQQEQETTPLSILSGPAGEVLFGALGLYQVEADGGATEVRRSTGWLEDLGSANAACSRSPAATSST